MSKKHTKYWAYYAFTDIDNDIITSIGGMPVGSDADPVKPRQLAKGSAGIFRIGVGENGGDVLMVKKDFGAELNISVNSAGTIYTIMPQAVLVGGHPIHKPPTR